MESPAIRFVDADDGVRLAYWALGSGQPFVQLPSLPHSHIELEWRIPQWRRGFELTAATRTAVRYDARGTGLSTREVDDLSLDRMVADLDAVVGALGSRPVVLNGVVNSCPIAITYAARYPERVSHLVLWCPIVDVSRHRTNARLEAARQIIETDWETFSETIAHAIVGWSEPVARQFAELVRAGIDQDQLGAFVEQMHEYDATDLLHAVACPTLLLHRAESVLLPMAAAEETAAAIPDARLVTFPGSSASPHLDDWRDIVGAIEEFLLDDHEVGAGAGRVHRRRRMKTDALSRREREVAFLVAQGLTNQEIATELVLSDRTVEHHVTRILIKLDLRSRTQVATHVVASGLAAPPA